MIMENYKVQYKEFTIIASPLELTEKHEWIPNVIIRVEKGNKATDRPIQFGVFFSSKEEATQYGFGAAQKYIDEGKANDLLGENGDGPKGTTP